MVMTKSMSTIVSAWSPAIGIRRTKNVPTSITQWVSPGVNKKLTRLLLRGRLCGIWKIALFNYCVAIGLSENLTSVEAISCDCVAISLKLNVSAIGGRVVGTDLLKGTASECKKAGNPYHTKTGGKMGEVICNGASGSTKAGHCNL